MAKMTTTEAAEILGIQLDADKDTTNAAYREAMTRWHPDKFRHSEYEARVATAMAKRINAARDTLFGKGGERGADPFAEADRASREREERAERERREQEERIRREREGQYPGDGLPESNLTG